MATIAISAGTMRRNAAVQAPTRGLIGVTSREPVAYVAPVAEPLPQKHEPSEIERVVKKMPTLYVIVFFGVVVSCAVLIIWNTLQVNRLTAERTKLDEQIAQTEQRMLRMRANEMQLSAPSRVAEIAKTKLGMIEATGDDFVIVK